MDSKLRIKENGQMKNTTIIAGDILQIDDDYLSLQRNGIELQDGSSQCRRSVSGMSVHDKQQLICFIADLICHFEGLHYKMTLPSAPIIAAIFYEKE